MWRIASDQAQIPSLLHSLPSVDVTGDLLAGLTTRTPVGVFMSDASGACRYVNDRWCELTGLTFARALGDGWAEAIHRPRGATP
jgi:PAS domain-containing protein